MTTAPTSQPIPSRITHRVEQIRRSKGLGRLHAADPRDHAFRLAALVEHVEPFTRYWPMTAGVLDQGATPECVAYAWTHFLLAAPTTHKAGGLGSSLSAFADQLYHRAQDVDEWSGSDYEGTSVRAGAKVLQADGRLSEYRWATTAQEARDYVLQRGPVTIGVNFYERFFVPDGRGFLLPEGEIAGGHAMLVIGYSKPRSAFRVLNSWSASWGQKGRCWIAYDVMQRLLSEDGECASGLEVKPPTEI